MERRLAAILGLAAFSLAVAGLITTTPGAILIASAQDKTQFIPLLGYRTGPYGLYGSAIIGGVEDYWSLLNERDGGIGGVKLVWEECEFCFNADRGVECYGPANQPVGETGLHREQERGVTLLGHPTISKIPLITIGYGRTDASDGRVFPYVFPMPTNHWSQNTAMIRYMAQREGGMDKLKGKNRRSPWPGCRRERWRSPGTGGS